jgi:aspartyl-tRNA(Asn)/glutamyl-tRNA(Gln) amidotransferase subunit B
MDKERTKFYPDLPKSYQITQHYAPLGRNGKLAVDHSGKNAEIQIERVHIEEDAGKLVHSSDSLGASEFSLVDYNRSCVPLLEIVNDHQNNPIRSITERAPTLKSSGRC